jgi:succinate dehydrogenase / fumarate reductase, cytochrome b subunit
MNKFFVFLNSSIGRKWLMSLTGLFLCLFLVVHLVGNLQLFKNDGGLAFNQYAVFMTTFPPIKVVSYVNYAFILLHAINGIWLVINNRKARPVKYEAKKDSRSSSWASQNMGLLGTLLLVFIVIHMGNFWRKFHWGEAPAIETVRYEQNLYSGETITKPVMGTFTGPKHFTENGVEVFEGKDLYKLVADDFSNPLYAAFYIFSMLVLAYHLLHGFQSAFQTLGVRRKPYDTLIKGIGNLIFGLVIPALFAAMPLYFLFFHK